MAQPIDMNEDAVIACADLVDRCGSSGFEIGCTRDDVPIEEAGWYASALFQGARIIEADHRSPTSAAMALAERLLTRGVCKCREPVTLTDGRPGCRWTLLGKRWEPGCNAPPIHVKGEKGDIAAMKRALTEPPNRAERRGDKASRAWGRVKGKGRKR